MGAALVLLLVGVGALAAGVLIGRYYVPDDRQLRRSARHGKAYIRALSHLIARDSDTAVQELRQVVEDNVDDTEPYFALGAIFRSRGEHERAIRVHQALAMRERDKRKLRQRAMYELGLDFRAAGMPRRATRALEDVLADDAGHDGAGRVLAALYEEQARFHDAAGLWQRIAKRGHEEQGHREHHLLVAAAQVAISHDDLDGAKQLLDAAHKLESSPHALAAAAELAAARGQRRAARDRIHEALAAEPGLVPHLLPALIAAEQGAANEPAGKDEPTAHGAAQPRLAAAAPDAAAARAGAQPRLATPDAPATTAAATDAAPDAAPAAVTEALVASPAQDLELRRVRFVPGLAPEASAALGPAARARVLTVLDDVEARSGPRLELALIRAQLLPAGDLAGHAGLAAQLLARFPESLAARVAAGRLASASGDPQAIRAALDGLVSDAGALAWTLRGRWQCGHCGHRPAAFGWRCSQCRRWGTLRMETGLEPPLAAPRERRALPRRAEGLLAAAADLPAATLDNPDAEHAGGSRRSLLGRVGGWVSGKLRRDPE